MSFVNWLVEVRAPDWNWDWNPYLENVLDEQFGRKNKEPDWDPEKVLDKQVV